MFLFKGMSFTVGHLPLHLNSLRHASKSGLCRVGRSIMVAVLVVVPVAVTMAVAVAMSAAVAVALAMAVSIVTAVSVTEVLAVGTGGSYCGRRYYNRHGRCYYSCCQFYCCY